MGPHEIVSNVLDYYDTQVYEDGEFSPMWPDVTNDDKATAIVEALREHGHLPVVV